MTAQIIVQIQMHLLPAALEVQPILMLHIKDSSTPSQPGDAITKERQDSTWVLRDLSLRLNRAST
jgi:hypothetical protein